MTAPNLDINSGVKLPTRVITYAWGDSYVNELLSLTIPALLAPGNLPYLASQVPCEVVLLTEERLFLRVSQHPAIVRLRTICPLKLIGLDDLITSPDPKYGMALTFALHRSFADLGPAMTDNWQVFLNADFIMADGCLRNMLRHLMRGERIVAAPSYCVISEEVGPKLLELVDPQTQTLSMSPRDMAKLALAHRHNTIRGKTINEGLFHIRYMEQFYWQVDENTLLGHQMPVAIVGMRPQRYVEEPNSYWDHGLIREYCPTAEPCIISDSDEFLMIELRANDVARDQFLPGWPRASTVAEPMILWVTGYQRDFALYPLTLHAEDLPEGVDDARKKLRAFVEEVLSYLPADFPAHVHHPQWCYHWTGFALARQQFLSTRLGSITETAEPPAYLSKFDRTWWEFDGKQKAYARRRAQLADEMDREIDLIQRASRSAEQEFLTEFSTTGGEVFSRISLDRDDGLRLAAGAGGSPAPGERVLPSNPYEDRLKSLQALLRDNEEKLRRAQERCADEIRALDEELKRINSEYLHLTAKGPEWATTLFQRMRKGPASPKIAPQGASAAGRLARRIYFGLFGQWPHVTKLNPYWSAFQPLHNAVGRAAAHGAKDVLFVGNQIDFGEAIVNWTGLHAWTSVAAIESGNVGGAFASPLEFDTCVCDLSLAELSKAAEIFAAARKFLRPGGTIVGFHLNIAGAHLPISDELAATLRNIPGARIYYGRSASLVKAFRSTLAVQRSFNVVYLSMMAVNFGLLAGWACISNLLESMLFWRRSVAPDRPTSITIEVDTNRTELRHPKFEGDNGTVGYAKDAGIYIDGVEAPVAPAHLVPAQAANPRGTTVILTFGQSNAANSGERKFAARGPVHVFNMFDGKFYRAADPLPGASNEDGSVWCRVGDKLIDAGVCRSVLFVPIAFGGTFIEDWAPGGQRYRRLMFALHRLKSQGIKPDLLCWHQGEADANHTQMTADQYRGHFQSMLQGLREAGIKAPVYVAVATLCEGSHNPFQNRDQIRLAQQQLVSIDDGVLPGPDTDQIGVEHRRDKCHFSASGQELAAEAWFKVIAAGDTKVTPVSRARNFLGRLFGSN